MQIIIAINPDYLSFYQYSLARWPSYLSGKLSEEVFICSKGPQAVKVADGGGQRFQFITATVQLFHKRQTKWKEKKQTRWRKKKEGIVEG